MADSTLYTIESANAKVALIITSLALSKLHLFNSTLTPNQFTTKVQLLAAEAAFDGYPSGGYALTAWTGPLSNPAGGAVETSPLVNIVYGPPATPPVTAVIGGWWIEDATGDVRLVGVYSPVRTLAAVGDGWAWISQIVEAQNPTVPSD